MTAISRLTLKTKAASLIAAILVIVIGLSTVMTIVTLTPRLRQAILRSSNLIAENLAKDIKKTVDLGVPLSALDGLSEKLTDIVKQYPEMVGYIFIADSAGKVLYESAKMPAGVKVLAGAATAPATATATAPAATTPTATPAATATATANAVKTINAGGVSFYDLTMPIASGEAVLGTIHMGIYSQVVSSQVNAILWRTLAIGLISFLAATGLIVFFVNRLISRPLEALSAAARTVAEGNLTLPNLDRARKDEIGQLAESFAIMVTGLSAMVGQSSTTSQGLEKTADELREVSVGLSQSFARQTERLEEVVSSVRDIDRLSMNLSENAKSLQDSAADSSSSILQTSSAIGEINRNMSQITSSVEDISAAILEMSTTVRQVASSAESTAAMAEETREAIGRINSGIQNIEKLAEKSRVISDNLKRNASDIGGRAMKETIQGILSIQQDVQHSDQAMRSLQERVENIGEIIGVIEEIADQTNLLALNASIISAQAGEQGRSFAVVANEIRELSTRTTDSTKKISSLITAAQQEAENYGDFQKRVIQSVVKGLGLGQEAERALEKIIVSADESVEIAALLAQVTREQSQASGKVSQSVEVFTQRAEEIKKATSEEAKGSEFIRDAMTKTKDMVEMVYTATDEQNRGSRLLAMNAEKSKEVALALARTTDIERQLCTTITKAVSTLKDQNSENSRRISHLNASFERMKSLATALKAELASFRTADSARDTAGSKPGTS